MGLLFLMSPNQILNAHPFFSCGKQIVLLEDHDFLLARDLVKLGLSIETFMWVL